MAERVYGNWEGTETLDWETDAYLMAEKAQAQERDWVASCIIDTTKDTETLKG